jgi:hypothetical protein
MSAAISPFASWENFYVIVGSSAAALTGLQFVVIVLGASLNAVTRPAMRAFGTPTIVHFSASLLVSAMLSAPWSSVSHAALALGIFALLGFLYVARITIHARKQVDYVPVLEDWLWHFILPALAYVLLLISAVVMPAHTSGALFAVGATVLLLLFIGIHNAWDAATYIAIDSKAASSRDREG